MLNRLYSWYGKRVVLATLFIIALLALILSLRILENEQVAEVAQTQKSVAVANVSELVSENSLSLIGTVEAVDESKIESEASGRITRVHATLGQSVNAGSIIAELENASERAAVLQAEGVYEAALARAAQNDVGVTAAETSLSAAKTSGITAYRAAYTTADDAVRNLADELFSNPTEGIIGFRLDGLGQTTVLNGTRISLREILRSWSENLSITSHDDADALLSQAKEDTLYIIHFMDQLSIIISSDENKDRTIDGTPMSTYQTRFSALRSALNTSLQNIEGAQNAIKDQEDALLRASLGGTEAAVSSANAEVKQALGSLRAAQATLAKTIIRTPIGGTVNALPVRVGDFIGSFAHVATVANNGALFITTFVSATDRDRIAVGDTVRIDGRATGTITNIAPAVDPDTKKIEVKIATDSEMLRNGDTVRVLIDTNGNIENMTDIIIPIAALKVLTDRVVVFTVSRDNHLVAHEVETGPLVGNSIVIESGVTPDMTLVTDARGLNEGDLVKVIE